MELWGARLQLKVFTKAAVLQEAARLKTRHDALSCVSRENGYAAFKELLDLEFFEQSVVQSNLNKEARKTKIGHEYRRGYFGSQWSNISSWNIWCAISTPCVSVVVFMLH